MARKPAWLNACGVFVHGSHVSIYDRQLHSASSTAASTTRCCASKGGCSEKRRSYTHSDTAVM